MCLSSTYFDAMPLYETFFTNNDYYVDAHMHINTHALIHRLLKITSKLRSFKIDEVITNASLSMKTFLPTERICALTRHKTSNLGFDPYGLGITPPS